MLQGLRDRIETLRKANETSDSWKCLVPDDGKAELYSDRQVVTVRHRALYLAKSYLLAIEKMNQHTWIDCCTMALAQVSFFFDSRVVMYNACFLSPLNGTLTLLKKLKGLGLRPARNGESFGVKAISALNRELRSKAVFPHPGRVLQEKPRVELSTVRFFEAFPLGKQ